MAAGNMTSTKKEKYPWKEGNEKEFIKTDEASYIIKYWVSANSVDFRSDDHIYEFISYLKDRDNYECFSESEQMDFEDFRIDLLIWMKLIKNPKRNDICIWHMDEEEEFIKTKEGMPTINCYLKDSKVDFKSGYRKEDFVSYVREEEGFKCKTDTEKKDFDMYREQLINWMVKKLNKQYSLLCK